MAGRVRPGQPVNVKVDAAGGRVFAGKVDSIGVMAESGGWRDPNLREYTVRIALDTTSPADKGDDRDDDKAHAGAAGEASAESTELKPSMRVEARIVLGSVEEGPTVPVQALFSEGPVQFVFVPEGNRFVRRPVRIGPRSETLARINAGLNIGDTVLLRTPTPGEVISRPWSDQQLADAGYTRDGDGNIVAPRGFGPGGPGGRPRRTGSAQPAGETPAAAVTPVRAGG
jgi:hypothetical protein